MKKIISRFLVVASPFLVSGCAEVVIAAAPVPAIAVGLAVELVNTPKQPVAVVDRSGKPLAGTLAAPVDEAKTYRVAENAVVCTGRFPTPKSKNIGRIKTKCSNGLIGQVRFSATIPYSNFELAGSVLGSPAYEDAHTLECNGKLSLRPPVAPFLIQCFDIASQPTVRPTLLGNGTYNEYEKSETRLGAAAVRRLNDDESELRVWINPPVEKTN